MALVAGRKRVPRPATGKMALRIGFMEGALDDSVGSKRKAGLVGLDWARQHPHGKGLIQLAAR
jgi:hypothetical protein